ncbi:thermonuclease family protein [Palleronia caenipelagi]|uniref:Thermonuclease family protein n=1 Tax=Palleronia caenipelagi TaxID=2489174 RepID=A0A547PK89_9RHOB|nr:thermonuclease family protein [Palleronia caenipelagi]TRD14540.1 thermonuclease family protein [Palleronia caenipelagi]
MTRIPRLPGEELLEGRVTHVRDGDTIEIGATPIRLASLDCAELDTAKGQRAKQRMQKLVAGNHLHCRLQGRQSYDREVGNCQLPDGRDIGAIMIRENYCDRFW